MDIDGTLVHLRRGSGFPPFEKALELCFGVRRKIPPETRPETDRALLESLAGPLPEVRGAAEEFFGTYARELRASLSRQPPGTAPNAAAFLETARARGLVCVPFTGNARLAAVEKLRAAGLLEAFDLDAGGYGDEARTKRKILQDLESGPDAAVVVGDSVGDIDAARACGLPVVAVATGWTSAGILQEARPDILRTRLPADAGELLGPLEAIVRRGEHAGR